MSCHVDVVLWQYILGVLIGQNYSRRLGHTLANPPINRRSCCASEKFQLKDL